ncbi:MAG TPA: Rieske 2Fe-2S domain-containing protein [Pyrinomonadaceae bacterium]|nr:Rieske 2Fe-2S domain-containing protein [Pyrinomonadaceae bacterium]
MADSKQPKERKVDRGRREFLLWVPVGIFAGLAATVATAAYRYLRPVKTAQDETWNDLGPVSSLTGDKPIMKSIVAEHKAGWASTLEEHFVYVLPHKNNQVVSNICPHESCNVAWLGEENQFFCPCHDSYFGADGERISGPSRRGLDPLPTREKDGRLQVKYQTYLNNTEERIVRG